MTRRKKLVFCRLALRRQRFDRTTFRLNDAQINRRLREGSSAGQPEDAPAVLYPPDP
ncbi:MAG: hypothetical protein KDA61_07035 [Planctomycetales bacterium]|nr:hypothetical protein [Planctomycetales bacterium]